jgi:hypothetical protein
MNDNTEIKKSFKNDKIKFSEKKVKKVKKIKWQFKIFGIIIFVVVISTIIGGFFINPNNCLNKQLPDSNLKDGDINYGKCTLYDECEIVNIAGEEELISTSRYVFPTTYHTDRNNCPLYWELPGYIKHIKNDCEDSNYGCCKSPIKDPVCSIRMHFRHGMSKKYNVDLYRKNLLDLHRSEYLDIEKEDINGTNCPSVRDLFFECNLTELKLYRIIIFIETLLLPIIFCIYTNKDIEFYSVNYEPVASDTLP